VPTLQLKETLPNTHLAVACMVVVAILILAFAIPLAIPDYFVVGVVEPPLVVVSPPTAHNPTALYVKSATALVMLPWIATTGSMSLILVNSLLRLKHISLPHPTALIRIGILTLE
jgi:hypothetical protein